MRNTVNFNFTEEKFQQREIVVKHFGVFKKVIDANVNGTWGSILGESNGARIFRRLCCAATIEIKNFNSVKLWSFLRQNWHPKN